MNKQWSELNKTMQAQLKKQDTFQQGLGTLFELRNDLMSTHTAFSVDLRPTDLSAMPFPNASGYHSKTIAYSLWHVFRIEDIVAHTLIAEDEQVFFTGDYQSRTRSPIITTGNELAGQAIADFSAQLDIPALYAYIAEVKASTEALLRDLPFDALKRKVSPDARQRLEALRVVSDDAEAAWLVDYWCGKDVRGLIQMPFSRHWIMHTEACLRIRDKLTA